ncbi:MAG: hypothetical protein EA412_05765 [Chitinophagaceae bacterium]|nr:MAG: hypothetical protein EA412_05765 [Chitinophagaceae bacterium]
MLKDIDFKKVNNVAMAVVPQDEIDGKPTWKVYLMNLKKKPILGVIINSKGYGKVNEKSVETSRLRQMFDKVEASSYVEVELLYDELTALTNEFWVSFWENDFMYDKKFVFVTESITNKHLTELPLLDEKGILIK